VVDADELKTGFKRSGIFYGCFMFLQKLGIALALLFSNIGLTKAGVSLFCGVFKNAIFYPLR